MLGATYQYITAFAPTLQFVSSTVWKSLFGKAADSLERSTENEDECEYKANPRRKIGCSCW